MKKIIPYIFITLILVNFLAPFTTGVNPNTNLPIIKKSKAEAGDIGLTLMGKATKTTIDLKFNVARFKETKNHGMVYMVTDKYGATVVPSATNPPPADYLVDLVTKSYDSEKVSGVLFSPPAGANVITEGYFKIGGADVQETRTIRLTDIAPNTTYYVSYAGFNGDKDDAYTIELDTSVKTKSADEADDDQFYELSSASGGGFLPACVWGLIKVSISGCIAQLLYAALFQPTAYLFGLAGKFFDFTFFYSISDNSYRSAFVIEGWGLVRDFVNIFFIFVLLWIAFSTILNVHGFKTKEMVVNVVIIGLLINFSMFATQVIIDTSNILARVFYNSIASPEKDPSDPTKTINAQGANGETQISAQIVGFANPQKLIAKANRVGVITKPGDQASNTGSNSYGLSNGTFILVTLLATVVNVVGIFVFVSAGLIFVARVLGLWLAIIFVPLAFFSYTVPKMKTIDMIGWEKWWPDTLKLAFLAPIFIFFMYLIIKFLGADSFLSAIKGDSGPEFIISIIFPFAFVMILMMKAKGIASKLAGDIGSGVTKAGVALGGAAIAGGALTAAFAGRQTLGAVNKYIQNDGARRNALKYQDTRDAAKKIKGWNAVNPFAYLNVAKKAVQGSGKFLAAGVAQGAHLKIGSKSLGKGMQNEEAAFGKKVSSQNKLDSAADNEFGGKGKYEKGVKFSELTEPEQQDVRKNIDKDQLAKQRGWKSFDDVKDPLAKAAIGTQIDIAHAAYMAAPKNSTAEVEAAEVALKTASGITGTDKASGDMLKLSKANASLGEFASSLRRGSYDIRELSKIKKSGALTGWGIGAAALLGGVFMPIGLALAASTSGAIKKGLKAATGGVDHGTAQKDFLKDLSHTINSALSHMKIDVKVGGEGGHTHAKASGGGGHH